jgi:hypothetical protein
MNRLTAQNVSEIAARLNRSLGVSSVRVAFSLGTTEEGNAPALAIRSEMYLKPGELAGIRAHREVLAVISRPLDLREMDYMHSGGAKSFEMR